MVQRSNQHETETGHCGKVIISDECVCVCVYCKVHYRSIAMHARPSGSAATHAGVAARYAVDESRWQ